MTSWKKLTLLVVAVALFVQYLPHILSVKRPPNFGGYVDPKFKAVEEAFRSNFEKDWERSGAMFAAYQNGKLVVDLHGGYMDPEVGRPWKEDTVTIAFSSTKAVCALVAAILVDRGFLDYDALVIKYWPEFGQHGKANVTVKMLLSHQAGLAAIDEPITYDVVRDWKKMSKVFEGQKPNWPPGTTYGYHAITYGFVVDQLIRRVDPKKRSIGQFLKEEITDPYDIDFSIGFDRKEWYRMARVSFPSGWDMVRRVLTDWKYAYVTYKMMFSGRNVLMEKIFQNPEFIVSRTTPWFNPVTDPELYSVEVGSMNGVGTARGLARILSLVAERHLLNNSNVLERIHEPLNTGDCQVLRLPLLSGWGFFQTKSPLGGHYYQIGHPGYGGQNVKLDMQQGLAFAYIRNGLSPDMGDICDTFMALQKALYDSL